MLKGPLLCRLFPIFLVLLVWHLAAGSAFAQSTAFTYQGRLTDAGGPANGQYDFQFKLFDMSTVGTGIQQGLTFPVSNLTVTAGTFTVQLDFGSGVFPGAPRFLEIGVKKTIDSTFTPLSPRQPVAANPYAIHTLNADGLSVACVSCITNPGASNLFAGESAGAANTTGFQNAFVGTEAGANNTAGRDNAFFGQRSGSANTTGGFNAFFGSSAGTSNTMGNNNSFFGFGAGTFNTTGQGTNNSTAIGFGATVSTDHTIVLGTLNETVRIPGSLNVTGSKNFKIDHPLDPENKYLYHAAIESSEVLNIYIGNVTTDDKGDAVVTLPEWFEAINRDFRYQLTVIGKFAQAIVASEIRNNRFHIKTNAPRVKVSWHVTGVCSDAVMLKHPFKVEEAKPESERGRYLNPEGFGQPEERGIEWVGSPARIERLKQQPQKH